MIQDLAIGAVFTLVSLGARPEVEMADATRLVVRAGDLRFAAEWRQLPYDRSVEEESFVSTIRAITTDRGSARGFTRMNRMKADKQDL